MYVFVCAYNVCSQELSKQIEGHTICALGDAAAWPVQVGGARGGGIRVLGEGVKGVGRSIYRPSLPQKPLPSWVDLALVSAHP